MHCSFAQHQLAVTRGHTVQCATTLLFHALHAHCVPALVTDAAAAPLTFLPCCCFRLLPLPSPVCYPCPACLHQPSYRIVATNKEGKQSPPETVGTITTAAAPVTAVPI